jgi:hypothetical protein
MKSLSKPGGAVRDKKAPSHGKGALWQGDPAGRGAAFAVSIRSKAKNCLGFSSAVKNEVGAQAALPP